MKIRVKKIITIGIIALTLISCSGELKKADYQVIPLPKNTFIPNSCLKYVAKPAIII